MAKARVHIVGCGLAGLSCAVRLADAGCEIRLYEAANHAGGRCRSFFEPALERRIDNGNHFLLSGNHAALNFLERIGSRGSLVGPEKTEFPFIDLATDERWTVAPSKGPVPWWIFSPRRRIPKTRLREYLQGLKLAFAGPEQTVSDVLDPATYLFARFWDPLTVAALNAKPQEGAARLLWPVVKETFAKGANGCRPLVAKQGLSESFIDPALEHLASHGWVPNFNWRLRGVRTDPERVSGLSFTKTDVALNRDDYVVLAVPPAVLDGLVDGIDAPVEARSIVNVHFLLPEPLTVFSITGIVGGLSQWVFVRDDIASVTISAAEDVVDLPSENIAERTWAEVRRALKLKTGPIPAYRVVKEKRATFAQTPAQVSIRPKTETRLKNLFLAGDATDTGLPATIEGSIRSGEKAAQALISRW